jgi:Tol biopolymer transport system component
MNMNSGKYNAKNRLAFWKFQHSPLITVALLVMLIVPWEKAFGQRYSDWGPPQNVGPLVNTQRFDGCPSITKDGLNLLYMSSTASSGFDMYVAHRETPDSPFDSVESLGPDLNTTANELCPSMTISGRYLFFVSSRPGGCGDNDIYVARRLTKNNFTEWGSPQNLGCEINSPGPELSPSLFEDEDGAVYLYFSSGMRPGGLGLGDIYVSRQQEDGTFGQVMPIVEFNTASNDIRPKIRARDGLEIFFDSNRPGSLLADIYTSTRDCTSCPWTTPVSLGSTVNSSGTDGGPALSFDGTELYFMSNRTGGSGDQDIWVTRREKLTKSAKD